MELKIVIPDELHVQPKITIDGRNVEMFYNEKTERYIGKADLAEGGHNLKCERYSMYKGKLWWLKSFFLLMIKFFGKKAPTNPAYDGIDFNFSALLTMTGPGTVTLRMQPYNKGSVAVRCDDGGDVHVSVRTNVFMLTEKLKTRKNVMLYFLIGFFCALAIAIIVLSIFLIIIPMATK